MAASKQCRECGADISGYPCSFCGAREGAGTSAVVGGIVLVTVVLFAVGMLASSGSKGESRGQSKPEPQHDAIEAWTVCKSFVEDRLKAPSTADFPWASEDYVTYQGNAVYRVRSYVDAENSFGAKIRNNFTCKVKYISRDRYKLQDLQIGGR